MHALRPANLPTFPVDAYLAWPNILYTHHPLALPKIASDVYYGSCEIAKRVQMLHLAYTASYHQVFEKSSHREPILLVEIYPNRAKMRSIMAHPILSIQEIHTIYGGIRT